jgi:hypothetical protein
VTGGYEAPPRKCCDTRINEYHVPTCRDHPSPQRGWEPWEQYRDWPNWRLPIAGPPCAGCEFWRPHIQIRRGEFDGVTCCVGEMCHDFSCYQPRKEPV